MLLITVLCFVFPGCLISEAAEWVPIGRGVLDSSGTFDVLVDKDTIERSGEDVQFWQAHVFYALQTLPEGRTYLRVLIRRRINCSDGSFLNTDAIFYDSEGNVVDNYKNFNIEPSDNPAPPGTVSEAVKNYICEKDENK